ncbi:MAG: hypothetical protein ACP5G2_04620 [Candidatus Bipolaricaulaceae bacterium]
MRRAIWLFLLAAALPAFGGQIRFDPAPIPLKGTFNVEVMGIEAETGEVVVVNLRTEDLVRVPLRAEGDRLIGGPIQALRPCDQASEETIAMQVAVGDFLVAATDLADELSVTARVTTPPAARPTLTLEDTDGALGPGKVLTEGSFRLAVEDAGQDVACAEEYVPVELRLGSSRLTVDAVEDGVASGRFLFAFTLQVNPVDDGLVAQVLHGGDAILESPLREGLALEISYRNLRQSFPLGMLKDAKLQAKPAVEDVGCPIVVTLSAPQQPDQVLWFLGGDKQAERGTKLYVIRSEATYPEGLSVVALVRQGGLWGRAEVGVVFVPPTELSFVDPDTGDELEGPCVCASPIQVKVTGAYDDPAPQVWIGKLGPDCSAQELSLQAQDDGSYLSAAFRPEEFGACAGQVLWIQYKDPTCPTDATYRLLALQ